MGFVYESFNRLIWKAGVFLAGLKTLYIDKNTRLLLIVFIYD